MIDEKSWQLMIHSDSIYVEDEIKKKRKEKSNGICFCYVYKKWSEETWYSLWGQSGACYLICKLPVNTQNKEESDTNNGDT